MKIIPIIFLFIIAAFTINAQVISPTVLATSGGYFMGSNVAVSWTMGECIVPFLNNSGITLSQGFQQSYPVTASIQKHTDEHYGILIYPNPAKDILTIKINSQDYAVYHLTLIDELGRILGEYKIEGQNIMTSEIDLSTLASAMYFLRVTINNTNTRVYKIEHFIGK